MEDIKEFFKSAKYRISSPVFYSFLVTWIAFNWDIILVFTSYSDHDALVYLGKNSRIAYIIDNSNWCKSFWLPLIFSSLGLLGYAILKNIFDYILTYAKSETEKRIITSTKNHSVDMDVHLSLKTELQDKKELIQRLLNESKEYLSQYESMKLTLIENSFKQQNQQRTIENLNTKVEKNHLIKETIISGTNLLKGTFAIDFSNPAFRNPHQLYITFIEGFIMYRYNKNGALDAARLAKVDDIIYFKDQLILRVIINIVESEILEHNNSILPEGYKSLFRANKTMEWTFYTKRSTYHKNDNLLIIEDATGFLHLEDKTYVINLLRQAQIKD